MTTEGQKKAYPKAPRMTVTFSYDGEVLTTREVVVKEDFAEPITAHQDAAVVADMHMAARKVQVIEAAKP